eukprot:6334927-Ditylum_brightwellii.AAC.1
MPPPPPPAYAYVQGDTEVASPITEESSIKQILYWDGFNNNAQTNKIFGDSITTFSDMKIYTEKDISDMVTHVARKAVANGQMNFGMRITERLKAFAHWVQDFV